MGIMEDRAQTPQPILEASLGQQSPLFARVVSRTPGRVRFRLSQPDRSFQRLNNLASILKERLEIYRVRTNLYSGSLTVFYAQDHSSFEQICAILQQNQVIFSDTAQTAPMATLKGKSETASLVTKALSGWNQRVAATTSGKADLRSLIPLGFGILAVRQLISQGLQLEVIPWYVLGWYAFDSFIKLHYTGDQASSEHSSQLNPAE